MPYFLRSQIPELSCYNRRQQKFLVREAYRLMVKDDAWFIQCLSLLLGLGVGGGTALGILFWQWMPWGPLTAAVVSFVGGVCFVHVWNSHLRQFLRQVIETQGTELEGMD